MRRCSGKANKLKYIYTIKGTSRDIAVKKRKINNIKIKIISLYFTFGPLRSAEIFSEKPENIIGLDSYILNSLNYLNVIWTVISHCMTSLLNLEITV